MKDVVISALARAVLLLLFLNGVRIILKKAVTWAVEGIRILRVPRIPLNPPEKADIWVSLRET